jgi:hypothetical protein
LQNSGIEKAFLFDVVSKIYIATDSSPVDMQSYELCSDMIDVVIDISCIYGCVCVGFPLTLSKRGCGYRQMMRAYLGVFVLSVAVLLLIAAGWPPFIFVRF